LSAPADDLAGEFLMGEIATEISIGVPSSRRRTVSKMFDMPTAAEASYDVRLLLQAILGLMIVIGLPMASSAV
jgi:hypothetical protein